MEEVSVSMFTADALSLELYTDWKDVVPTQMDMLKLGTREVPIDLDASPAGVFKLEDVWADKYAEPVDLDNIYGGDEEEEQQHQQQQRVKQEEQEQGEQDARAPPSPAPPVAPDRPEPAPEPDAFERYLKVKMKRLDRKRRQAEEEAREWARARRDVIESIDSIADPEDEAAQLAVELKAWDTRVKQMTAAVLAAKAGRKATRLKMELGQYRRGRGGVE